MIRMIEIALACNDRMCYTAAGQIVCISITQGMYRHKAQLNHKLHHTINARQTNELAYCKLILLQRNTTVCEVV